MKKLISMLVTLMLLATFACAEDLQVQIIGGEDVPQMFLDIDDMQLGQTYEIDGYARITPVSFTFADGFLEYALDFKGDNTSEGDKILLMESGTSAEFAELFIDCTNLMKENIDFTTQAKVTAVFDDDYEFAGWVRMFNYDYDMYDRYGEPIHVALNPENSEETSMMYTAHLLIGCTLPTAVVEGTEPLRIVIGLGGNELTYNIR